MKAGGAVIKCKQFSSPLCRAQGWSEIIIEYIVNRSGLEKEVMGKLCVKFYYEYGCLRG